MHIQLMRLADFGEIKGAMSKANLILEVLDARDPWTTRSRKVEEMASSMGKKVILVMNKSDLVPREVLDEWVEVFRKEGLKATYISARERMGTMKLRRFIKREAPEFPAVVLVVGFPKVGKSSIINVLKGRSSASTSPIPGNPGYTRSFQLFRIERKLYLVDSPGIIPIEGGPLEMAIRGCPPEKLNNPIEAASSLIERALRADPSAIKRAYGIEGSDPLSIIEELARKRGWVSGGELRVEEAARQIIRDYHTCKLNFYISPKDLGLSS
ncbi:GTPase RsgA [Candidatus Korarchaeum cryptofilum]|uniref:GTP-binding protein HSR1-related n=3 Tax=Candidatus Korarchaeum cryptofilum TaxID=498846 RepID=B1L3D2_KORCO|nr:GTP-binding protein HSR1-related [Candidatus Korarchaeum cryptofilum OPF8]RSN67391.1 GTPase RsgA [Candidatus Korarchaeum cryptofilum]